MPRLKSGRSVPETPSPSRRGPQPNLATTASRQPPAAHSPLSDKSDPRRTARPHPAGVTSFLRTPSFPVRDPSIVTHADAVVVKANGGRQPALDRLQRPQPPRPKPSKRQPAQAKHVRTHNYTDGGGTRTGDGTGSMMGLSTKHLTFASAHQLKLSSSKPDYGGSQLESLGPAHRCIPVGYAASPNTR